MRTDGRQAAIRDTPRLEDLFDVAVLEQIQDWFAATANLTTRVRGIDGRPVTRASHLPRFCQLINQCQAGRGLCTDSSRDPIRRVAATGKPVKYQCHAGLTQFAAPIEVEGRLFGVVLVGGMPEGPMEQGAITELAERIGADPDGLSEAVREIPPWRDEMTRPIINVLLSITKALASIFYRGYLMQKHAERLTTVYGALSALTAPLSLRERLKGILAEIAEALGAKGASLRLLDATTGYLELRATYGLSDDYLGHGPILPEKGGYHGPALAGEAVTCPDVTKDDAYLYREAAIREGLCSLLCVGLIHRGRAIGTVSIWTGEPREFREDEIELTKLLARQAAVAVEAAMLFDDLRRTNRHLRRAYQDLVETQEVLVAADRLVTVGRLAAGITHDIRNALASMSTIAAALRDRGEALSADKREDLAQRLVDQVMRLQATLEDTQQYAKPVDSRERSEVRLDALVADAVEFIRLDEALREVDFQTRCASAAPTAWVNEKRMRQVLSNLLRNAAQAAGEGGGHVWVECRCDDSAALISVSDDGPGIAQSIQDKIWDPFFTTKGEAGMGLGLDICQRIVAAHGGTIGVRSGPGQGATFTIRLPLTPEQPDTADGGGRAGMPVLRDGRR